VAASKQKFEKKSRFLFEQNKCVRGLDISAKACLIGTGFRKNFWGKYKIVLYCPTDFGGGFVQAAAGKPLRLQLY
jgi:hypothetical protein